MSGRRCATIKYMMRDSLAWLKGNVSITLPSQPNSAMMQPPFLVTKGHDVYPVYCKSAYKSYRYVPMYLSYCKSAQMSPVCPYVPDVYSISFLWWIFNAMSPIKHLNLLVLLTTLDNLLDMQIRVAITKKTTTHFFQYLREYLRQCVKSDV